MAKVRDLVVDTQPAWGGEAFAPDATATAFHTGRVRPLIVALNRGGLQVQVDGGKAVHI